MGTGAAVNDGEEITNTKMNLKLETPDGESADDLTKLAVKDQSGAGSYALQFLVTETLGADRALTIVVGDAARTITLGGNLTTQNNNVIIDASGASRTLTLAGDSTLDQDLQTTDSPTFGGITEITDLTASKPVFTTAGKALTSTGTLGADQGGTGQAGGYAVGDVLYASGAAALSKLAAVAAGQVLISAGTTTAPAWSASPVIGTRLETKILNLTDDTELTIASGVVTAVQSYHMVDTESDGGTDDLDGIDGTSEGDVVIIFPADAARTIVAKHAASPGSGKALNLAGGVDFTMDEDDDFLMLLDDGTVLQEISRSENHS